MRYTINEQIDAMNIKSVDFNLRESVRALTDKDLVDFKSTYTSTPGILKSAILLHKKSGGVLQPRAT